MRYGALLASAECIPFEERLLLCHLGRKAGFKKDEANQNEVAFLQGVLSFGDLRNMIFMMPVVKEKKKQPSNRVAGPCVCVCVYLCVST